MSIVRVRFRHTSHILTMLRTHRYRYQLEAFIDKIRGRDPEHWVDAQDSITNLEWIEAVYKEVGCSHRVSIVSTSRGPSALV